MNHILKATEDTTFNAQDAVYRDPSLPLHPKLVPELVRFLNASLGNK